MKQILGSVLFLLVAIHPLFGQESIQRSNVERLIRTLAADSMEGRASLTPGNAKAARFIASEFASIGLTPIPGETSYVQNLPVTVVTPGPREVSLNGTTVAPEEILVLSSAESLSTDRPEDFVVAYVGKEGSIRQKLSAARNQDKSTLLLISRAQQKNFDRFKRFAGGRTVNDEPAGGPSIIAILADSVPVRSVRVRVRNTVEAKSLQNIAGMIRGRRSDEFVLFSAHYDHLGIVTPVDGDSIANGADDDASGTTAVMTLARYFAGQGTPERSILFVAFAAEEIGGFGSHYFSKRLKPQTIIAMCNIEMIGMPSKFGPNSAWITGYDRSDFGKIIQEASAKSGFSLYPDPYPEQNLFFRSDNATLARLGVPAHSVSSSQIDTDPFYHSVKDEIVTLDLDHMTTVIRGLAAGLAPIIAGEKTPTRITDATRK